MKYGIERMIEDLTNSKYENLQTIKDTDGMEYVLLPGYCVTLGRFVDKIIDLAIPVPADYPRSVGSSIHIRVNPQLLEKADSVPGVRNITDSKLGAEWRYWSFSFKTEDDAPTAYLIHQINGVFRNI